MQKRSIGCRFQPLSAKIEDAVVITKSRNRAHSAWGDLARSQYPDAAQVPSCIVEWPPFLMPLRSRSQNGLREIWQTHVAFVRFETWLIFLFLHVVRVVFISSMVDLLL